MEVITKIDGVKEFKQDLKPIKKILKKADHVSGIKYEEYGSSKFVTIHKNGKVEYYFSGDINDFEEMIKDKVWEVWQENITAYVNGEEVEFDFDECMNFSILKD